MGALFEVKENTFTELKHLRFQHCVVSQTMQLNTIEPIEQKACHLVRECKRRRISNPTAIRKARYLCRQFQYMSQRQVANVRVLWAETKQEQHFSHS